MKNIMKNAVNRVYALLRLKVVDPASLADAEALQRAKEHGCVPALLLGGVAVAKHHYKYVYQLTECEKKLITVTIDSQGEAPPP